MFKRAAFFENLGSRDGSGNCAYADRIFPQGFSVDLFFDVVRGGFDIHADFFESFSFGPCQHFFFRASQGIGVGHEI